MSECDLRGVSSRTMLVLSDLAVIESGKDNEKPQSTVAGGILGVLACAVEAESISCSSDAFYRHCGIEQSELIRGIVQVIRNTYPDFPGNTASGSTLLFSFPEE